ncbi:hypothetical protein BKA93DRAFT_577639 [Sparassis latifolia]
MDDPGAILENSSTNPLPGSGGSSGPTSQSKSAMGGSRYSPVTPLAPLEFLQNQRRGSITDPSLHASPPMSHSHSGVNSIPPSLRVDPVSGISVSSSSHEPQRKSSFSHPRPESPYKFGEASTENANIRRILRSPSIEGGVEGTRRDEGGAEQGGAGRVIGESSRVKGTDGMEIDAHGNGEYQQHDTGTKRKLSSTEQHAPDIDPQLVGPGVPSEGRAAKRRESGYETQRMGELSLDERRNSVDGRGGGWWGGERRESVASTSVSTPLSGYSTPGSAVPGESPRGRAGGGMATFAWPANPQAHPDQAAAQQMQPEEHNADLHTLQYDSHPPMPPVAFPADRRLSAPTIATESPPIPPSTGPTRVLRSRSRPPSRVRTAAQAPINNAGPSSSTPTTDTPQVDDAPQLSREQGSTPYSRSPELRVSHKLAERKRRKEMKDLFDELREQLPSDRGMKSSKWEILSKAIDFIMNLKQSHQDMSREIEVLRHELDNARQGMAPPFPGGPPHVVYSHGPPVGVAPYPPPGGPMHPHQPPPPQSQQAHPSAPAPGSRPGSSQNVYPPSAPPAMQQNMNGSASGAPRTETPS